MIQVYVFNISNAAEVLNDGAAPIVTVVGPVRFLERWSLTTPPPVWELGGDVISYFPAVGLDPCDEDYGSLPCGDVPDPVPLPLPLSPATLHSRVWTVNMPWLLAESNGLWGLVQGGREGTPMLRELELGELL